MTDRIFEEFYNDIAHHELPEDFTIFEVALVGGDGTMGNFTHSMVRGASFEPITRGRRKGEPNWKKTIDGTARTFYVELMSQRV